MTDFRKISRKSALELINGAGVLRRYDLQYGSDEITEYYELPTGEIMVFSSFLLRIPVFSSETFLMQMRSTFPKDRNRHVLSGAPRLPEDFLDAQHEAWEGAAVLLKKNLSQTLQDLRLIDKWVAQNPKREDREKSFLRMCLLAHHIISLQPGVNEIFRLNTDTNLYEPFFEVAGQPRAVQIFTILWDEFFENFRQPCIYALVTQAISGDPGFISLK